MRPRRSTRYETLDHWRGVACLGVVALHSTYYAPHAAPTNSAADALIWLTSAGWFGVPMFFVISGYCIAASADAHRRKGRPVGEYFRKRLRRIFPPYWAALALSAVAVASLEWVYPTLYSQMPHGFRLPAELGPWHWFGNLTLTESWRPHFVGGDPRWVLSQSWTLAFEEQFYFVVGLTLLAFPRRFFPALAVVTAAEVAVRVTAERLGAWKSIEWFWFDGRWEQFAAGVLVYYAANHARGGLRVACYAALVAGFGLSIDRADLIRDQSVAWAFAVAVAALHPFDARLARLRALKPLEVCGVMCYSVYLLHWPIAKGISHALADAGVRSAPGVLLITLPLCVAASVLIGWAFHVAVERRFMSAPQRAAAEEAAAEIAPVTVEARREPVRGEA